MIEVSQTENYSKPFRLTKVSGIFVIGLPEISNFFKFFILPILSDKMEILFLIRSSDVVFVKLKRASGIFTIERLFRQRDSLFLSIYHELTFTAFRIKLMAYF